MATILGEALLATTGVMAALEPGPVRVTKALLRKADGLPERIRERLANFLKSDGFAPAAEPGPLDYERLLELLPPPVTPERMAENVAGWVDQELANEYAKALGGAWGYLQARFPIRVRDHITGPENVRPSGLELARFRRLFDLVEDPTKVLERLEEGSLLASEVEVLKEVYPALYTVIAGDKATGMPGLVLEALVEETARRRKADPDWHLPKRKEVMLRRLLQLPKGAAEARTLAEVRRLYEEGRQESQPPQEKPAPAGKGAPESDRELTRTQRLDLRP